MISDVRRTQLVFSEVPYVTHFSLMFDNFITLWTIYRQVQIYLLVVPTHNLSFCVKYNYL